MTLRMCLVGASGRMGREIASAVLRSRASGGEHRIVSGVVAANDPALRTELPGIDTALEVELKGQLADANVIVDFSSAAATRTTLACAAERRLPVLIGTTGISPELASAFEQTARIVPVIRTSNTSVGVTAMLEISALAASLLGESFDIELVEAHHRGKVDAPSGTALSIATEIAECVGISNPGGLTLGRAGDASGRVDGRREIGVQSVRGGDVVGEHTVFYLGKGERLEITHRATSRSIFADGALRAAEWLIKQSAVAPGLFSMKDVLRG